MATNTTKPNVQIRSAKVTEEVWKDSTLFSEVKVSNLGRVQEKGYKRVVPEKGGSFRIYDIPAKILEPTESASTGDLVVSFSRCGDTSGLVSERVDVLVATEFVTNTDTRHFSKIKHQDGNKANVKASNLAWTGSGLYAK